MLWMPARNALLASFLLASGLFSRSSASPLPSDDAAAAHEFDERASYYAITGAAGGVQPRLEVRTLYVDYPNQFNLYLLALQRLQSLPQNEQTSWFQIAGIHGSPNIPWDNVQQSAPGVGYCTHGSNLFPTWHRPYLALFEQKLTQVAMVVANEFPASTRQTYINAANTLRIPYYDWAINPPSGLPAFPDIMSTSLWDVTTPTGPKTIVNPLFRFGFHPINAADVSPYGQPWSYWPFTLRYPTSTAQTASSQDNDVASTIANNRVGQKQNLYNWFTLCPTYLEISNDLSSSSSSSCHISLESLHNNIHDWIGGSNDGHMSVIPVSAFDPSFMLHHAQIDRLFAMWQAIYPNSYITPQASAIETFTINQGDVEGGTSPLTPFHKNTAGDFWTSAAVRQHTVFHYTYPEFLNTDGSSSAMRGQVNNLYGPNSNAQAAGVSAKRELPLDVAPLTVPKQLLSASNGSEFQYIANIATTRFGLGTSYLVYVFFDDPTTEDPGSWGTDPKLIGSMGVFAMPGMEESDLITTCTVPLTTALCEQVGLGSLEALDEVYVIPYLQKKLQWRVATCNLEELNPATVPDFVLSVVASTTIPPANDSDFPVWSPFVLLNEITHGKPGGINVGETLSYLGQPDHLSDLIL